jgi:two-component SAPR family response regulator
LQEAVSASSDIETVEAFSSCSAALAYATENPIDIAFLDINMRGIGGLGLAEKLLELQPQCKIVFCTGYKEYAVSAFQLHVSGYLMKPITPEAVQKEIDHIKGVKATEKLLTIKCFGNFEVFAADGEPIKFSRTKAKELFAYLVYRRGTSCSVRELAAVLFEDKEYSTKQMLYLQKIISSMMQTLKEHNAAHVIHKSYNAIAIDDAAVDCDYYRFLKMDVPSINTYTGDFMTQYSWAEFVSGYLDRITTGSSSASEAIFS